MSFMIPQIQELPNRDKGGKSLYRWRLSAPGYLDCTEWSLAQSLGECVNDCLGMYGDNMDKEDLQELSSYLDGYQEFWDGYLLALGFTARVDDEEGSGGHAFDCAGGRFEECYMPDEIEEVLTSDDWHSLFCDCLDFFVACCHLFNDEFENAGGDFHFTRNGHGVGFWDRDCYNGREAILTDVSKPYGTAELLCDVSRTNWYVIN